MGTLFLVATPIGNLEDITLRALRVLREVRLIAAEDTRHTRTLLDRYAITTPCVSYHEHNKLVRQAAILEALALGDVALVSDAGTPAVADPGFELVGACIAAGFPVSPIPGPSAPLAALVASGLPSERFAFVGFLPRQRSERRALLEAMAELTLTLICFETPHRLCESLEDMQALLGERQVVVASELTKRFEALRRGTLAELVAYFSQHNPRGEYTLVIAGRPTGTHKRDRTKLQAAPASDEAPSEAAIAQRLRQLREQGMAGSAAARTVARELGVQKSLVYQVWLGLEQEA
ncbi:MAG: 16S rRNA (cytidine(1402)-2'-O)-methyltransferase [Candidatus Viridilinea halotolerans]|uniref:Ribosomal RNA small subunit methyltransferase I n=1 Tax=Candidatus Viridilinea halotolerans TaxID=2491704 RepID=A0A426UAP1_9CHLR|nr:MAG: 16S rRNA (cytidine(1402)-2'-O)-methyltransferase [Candidatus Viridilinea halotolerans]